MKAGTFTMTAIVVVNALGDISDYETGKKLAGLKNSDRTEYISCEETLYQFMAPRDMFTGNTTIGAIITNAAFNKAELNKIASMARNAYARCINPVGTMADGDTIYAASIDNCITRLRLEVKDITLVNDKVIKSAGVAGVMKPGKTSVQVIIGTKVQFVADAFSKLAIFSFPPQHSRIVFAITV